MTDPDSHTTHVTADPTTQTAVVTCTCGQTRTVSHARPTGAPVAARLAGIHGTRHEQDPTGNPLTDPGTTPDVLIFEDEVATALDTSDAPDTEHTDKLKQLIADVTAKGRYAGLRTVTPEAGMFQPQRASLEALTTDAAVQRTYGKPWTPPRIITLRADDDIEMAQLWDKRPPGSGDPA